MNLSRNDLAKLFTGVGAEVGVEQGEFSEVICQYAKKLYAVDAWKAYRAYRDHTRQAKLDTFYDIAKKRLAPYECEVIKGWSMDAVQLFDYDSLDFVYIDANHDYQHVTEDITEWAKVVKPGGIVAGHDYTRRKGQDHLYAVVAAVNDYVKEHNKELTIWRGDSPSSWSFIE